MAKIGFVDQTYWGARLHVGAERIRDLYADDDFMAAWLDELSPRCQVIRSTAAGSRDHA